MSIGKVSTFLDIYIQRDLEEERITEEQAQEFMDHFVMKLRMIRFLRTPAYDALFSGDPVWVTESLGGMDTNGKSMVTKNRDRKSTRLNSSHANISYAVFCLKKKIKQHYAHFELRSN